MILLLILSLLSRVVDTHPLQWSLLLPFVQERVYQTPWPSAALPPLVPFLSWGVHTLHRYPCWHVWHVGGGGAWHVDACWHVGAGAGLWHLQEKREERVTSLRVVGTGHEQLHKRTMLLAVSSGRSSPAARRDDGAGEADAVAALVCDGVDHPQR